MILLYGRKRQDSTNKDWQVQLLMLLFLPQTCILFLNSLAHPPLNWVKHFLILKIYSNSMCLRVKMFPKELDKVLLPWKPGSFLLDAHISLKRSLTPDHHSGEDHLDIQNKVMLRRASMLVKALAYCAALWVLGLGYHYRRECVYVQGDGKENLGFIKKPQF